MKNKYIAAILSLLLGWIGIHRFYIGSIGLGFVYLFFSWTFIPFLISLVEFLYFLIISKKEFDIKFNAEYMRNKEYIENKTRK